MLVLFMYLSFPLSQHIIDHIMPMTDLINTTDNAAALAMGDFNDLCTDVIEQHTLMTQIVSRLTRDNTLLEKMFTNIPDNFCEPLVFVPIAI